MLLAMATRHGNAASCPAFVQPEGKFNRWQHKIGGLYAVELVERRPDLTDGQKLLYNRAVRWAGHKGHFWHSFDTMAEALGKSVR
jgi:hypothetical protein